MKSAKIRHEPVLDKTPLDTEIAHISHGGETEYLIPTIFEQLLLKPKRYKIFYGGRGAAKTMSFATIITLLCYNRMPIQDQPFRVLCGREFQSSISESVAYEIIGAYRRLGLARWFKATGTSIRCLKTGAQILFRGLHHNIDQIKSLGGIDLFWGEEAHSFTNDTLIYIDPTIRRDPPFGPLGAGSELWFSLNQHLDTDPVYVKYKLAQGAWEDEDTLVVPCTWKDNQFFPQVLERQRRASELNDQRDHYEWVWGTQCRNLGGIFFAVENLLVDNKPIEPPTLCDAVFAVIDTATKTGKEHDGTAVLYCAANRHGVGHPMIILDYDYVQIEGSLLEAWLPNVFGKLKDLSTSCKARAGVLGCWIEDKSSGMVLLQQAQRRGWPAQPIESKLTAMGKVERAISVSGYVFRGMVKISRPAFDKVVAYKGVTLNHLLSQVKAFRVGDTEDRDDDALDTFCYAIAISLGNQGGF